MSKRIKIGNDKQPAPLVTKNVPLYNIQTGQPLTDAGGIQLVSSEDTFLTSEASSDKATSVVYTDEKPYATKKNILLSGTEFIAYGKTIEVTSGDGLFLGENIFKLSFVSESVLSQGNDAYEGLVIENTDTGSSGTIQKLILNTGFKSGSVVVENYSDSKVFENNVLEIKDSNGDVIDTITIVNVTFIGREGELKYGDKLLLPTGYENNTNVYETRIVMSVESANKCFVDLDVTYNRINQSKRDEGLSGGNVFGKLVKLKPIVVAPNLKVEENFASFSEVSTSILGYPKSEEQLGLFSNVSTYGLDENEFLFYRRDDNIDYSLWETRKNKVYGNRYRSRYREVKEEAAVAIESFRTPFTYPYGPNEVGYQSESYTKFNTFLKLGMVLYDVYKESNPIYALNFIPYTANYFVLENVVAGQNALEDNGEVIQEFIDNEEIVIDGTDELIGTVLSYDVQSNVLHLNEEHVDILKRDNIESFIIKGQTSGSTATITQYLDFDLNELTYSALLSPLNPYYSNEEELLAQIDTWTEVWRRIGKQTFFRLDGNPLTDVFIDANSLVNYYLKGKTYSPSISGTVYDNSYPGYSTSKPTRSYLESRKSFRYQPGRISGYTFGVRASNDINDPNVVLEWGIGNNTDDLVFQIKGRDFSVVRRSVVPLDESVLRANSLEPEDQIQIVKDTQNNELYTGLENKIVYETKIVSDKWNGDPLNGNGPSGHKWNPEDVTMYKIEFGWYGAIGVQFYAYVPVNNGDARWVKLHRLIIENKLGQPCMGDPYYKFKYSLVSENQSETTIPQYIYKYGTSCYIDGGDEGTVRVNSVTSDLKTAPVIEDSTTTVLAIQPKTSILSSSGISIKNKQQILPKEFSVNSTGLTEIKLVKCKGCPEFGHTYQPNLKSGNNGDERKFKLLQRNIRDTIELQPVEKTVYGVSGEFALTMLNSESNTQYIRVGDIVKQTEDLIQADTVITNITENETDTVITLSKALLSDAGDFDAQIGITIEFQPVFLQNDLYSKIIADRIYLTYIKEFESSAAILIDGNIHGYESAKLGTIDSSAVSGDMNSNMDEYLIDREIPIYYLTGSNNSKKLNFYPLEFTGKLSKYRALAASPVSVNGTKNRFLFLKKDSYESSGQLSDFRVGVTSLKPQYDSENITWVDKNQNSAQLTESNKLYLDYFMEGISTDISGYEIGESNLGRVPAFTVDYRISNPGGSNTGDCSFIELKILDAEYRSCSHTKGSVLFSSYNDDQLNALQDAFTQSGYTYDSEAYYVSASSFKTSIQFNPDGGEVGFNSANPTDVSEPPLSGSGINFVSDIITVEDPNDSTQTIDVIKLSSNLSGLDNDDINAIVIWFIPISLESYRKTRKKIFNYSPFPLYFFVEMMDNGELNGSVIKEETQVSNTYNPRWYVSKEINESQMTITNESILVGSIDNLSTTTGDLDANPPSFTSEDRLSSSLVDVRNESQMRPYEVVDNYYVGAGTKTISLANIFDYEKETITPDLLNTTAYFFLASSKEEGTTTEVQATLTYIEQQ